MLCCAVLCCQVLSGKVPLTDWFHQMPRGVLSRPLPLWPIHFPQIAPWATIISAGPERTINPPLVLASRLVPILLEVGARQPAASARTSSSEATRLHFTLCSFSALFFCAGAASRTASNPSLFLFPFQALFLAVTPPKPIRHPSGLRSGSARQSFPLVSCSVVSAQSSAPSNPIQPADAANLHPHQIPSHRTKKHRSIGSI